VPLVKFLRAPNDEQSAETRKETREMTDNRMQNEEIMNAHITQTVCDKNRRGGDIICVPISANDE